MIIYVVQTHRFEESIMFQPQSAKLEKNAFQTKVRGTDDSEYQIYLDCADDGKGIDITTGRPLKTYDEWLKS